MAPIDKISVREQVEQQKQQFERLRATGKVHGETPAVMSSLLIIIELILSIAQQLENIQNEGSENLEALYHDLRNRIV